MALETINYISLSDSDGIPAAPCPHLPPPLPPQWKQGGSGWTPHPAGGAADTGCPAGAGSAGSWYTVCKTC